MSKVVPAGDRYAKWNLKYDPARIKEITEAGKPTYYQHAQVQFIALEQMELGVKQVLDSLGVPPKDVPQYLNAGRQFWRACQTYSGETLSIKAVVILDRWVGEGLTQSVLEAIRNQVFHIPAPAGP